MSEQEVVADVAGVRIAGHRLGGRHGRPTVLDRTHSFLFPTPPATNRPLWRPHLSPTTWAGYKPRATAPGAEQDFICSQSSKHGYAARIAQRWARLFEVCRGCEKLDK